MHCRCGLALLAVICFCACVVGADAPSAGTPAARTISVELAAQVQVGSATKAQVAELLGQPWRIMNDEDCHPVGYQGEAWEYIAQDSDGSVKINVQFDSSGIARLVGRSSKGKVVVLAAAPPPPPNRDHQH